MRPVDLMDLKLSRTIKFTIDSRLEHVALLGLAVRSICAPLPLSPTEVYQIELSVVEAANNIIKHAYRGQPGHAVEVIATISADHLIVEICDSGIPIPKERRTAADYDPTDVLNLPESGMGLHIIHTAMDKVEYERHGHKNILRLIRLFQ
ncbi:MAG: ATP-binding protein [Desulforhabdus sp.]|nr:ATP-binding protein [Desulforhabdus sp.]